MGYQRAGMGANPGVNSTTIFIPGTGPGSGFLTTPGNAATAQGGGGGSSYVAPNVIPTPACALGPAATADSQECQVQVAAVNQQNMQLRNNANYNVDLQNCLNTFPQPPDCYTRTFGLTPTGGYTSDANAGPKGSTLIVDANGNPVATPPPVFSSSGTPNPYIAAPTYTAPPTPPAPPSTNTQNGGSGNTAQNYVDQATSFLTGDVTVAGSQFPVWALAAAAGLALFFLGGHR